MFNSTFTKKCEDIISKLKRKDLVLFKALQKKIIQVIQCDSNTIQNFKNLRGNLSHLKRVHVGSFVLTFQVQGDIILFEDFVHHDKAY